MLCFSECFHEAISYKPEDLTESKRTGKCLATAKTARWAWSYEILTDGYLLS